MIHMMKSQKAYIIKIILQETVLLFKIPVSCLKQILSKSLVDVPICFIYCIYTVVSDIIKCSCLNVQILSEKVQMRVCVGWGGS